MRKNVDPRLWGPPAWEFLGHCAESVDDDSFPSFVALVGLLPSILPCESCRSHCAGYIRDHPLRRGYGVDVKAWLEEFRANVKRRVGASEWGGNGLSVKNKGTPSLFPNVAILIALLVALAVGVAMARRF